MNRSLDVVTSHLASVARGTGGLFCGTSHLGPRPARLLELYEFEACPFCRKVREMLTFLDLEALVHPCPKRGKRSRDLVKSDGGKHQFPWLVDPNTGTKLYESRDIVRYLARTYGDGTIPIGLLLGPVPIVTGSLASLVRLSRGSKVRPSRAPDQPLELWSFEASPYCRIVRETLCELELDYVLHNVGKGSPSRPPLVARAGKMMVPYLFDPNTGEGMFESGDIVAYLERTYASQLNRQQATGNRQLARDTGRSVLLSHCLLPGRLCLPCLPVPVPIACCLLPVACCLFSNPSPRAASPVPRAPARHRPDRAQTALR